MAGIEIRGPRARAAQLRKRYRLTAADVGLATNTAERTVRRWENSTDDRQSRSDGPIRCLEKVIVELEGAGLDSGSVRSWLREPAEYLDDRSPLAALGAGDYVLVDEYVQVSTLGISVGRKKRRPRDRRGAPERDAVDA